MSGVNPPKLSYAKGRKRSKNKNQTTSQQHIVFETQSSNDIFTHLNQDNLNYIKKELKHKKSITNNQQKLIANTEQKQRYKEDQNKIVFQIPKNSQLQNNKSYNFHQNRQISERNTHQSKKQAKTTLVNSLQLADNHERLNKNKNNEMFKSHNQDSKYFYLMPPPSTLNKIQQTTSNQSIIQPEIYNLGQKTKQQSKYEINYQLKSSNSHNQLDYQNQVQNNFSSGALTSLKAVSTSLRGSHFIGHLQNYIQQLNHTPQKIRRQASKINEYQQIEDQSNESSHKNFKKIKNQKSSNINDYKRQRRQIPDKLRSLDTNHPFSLRKQKIDVERQNIYPLQKLHDKSRQTTELMILNKQYQRQKFYCLTLAAQLQKYKENERKFNNQNMLLTQTVHFLKKQTEYLRQVIKDQLKKNIYLQDLYTNPQELYINPQELYTNRQKLYTNPKQFYTNNQGNLSTFKAYNQKLNDFTSNQYKQNNFTHNPKKDNFDIQNNLRLNRKNPVYTDLNLDFYKKLSQNFQQGRQSYLKDKPISQNKQQNKAKSSRYQKLNNKSFLNQESQNDQQLFQNNIKKSSNNIRKQSNNKRKQSREIRQQNKNLNKQYDASISYRKEIRKSSLQKLKDQYKKFKAESRQRSIGNNNTQEKYRWNLKEFLHPS